MEGNRITSGKCESNLRDIRTPTSIQPMSIPTHRGVYLLVAPCALIDKVLPSVARLSHTLVIVGGRQLRPPVIRGPLGNKEQNGKNTDL